MSIIVVDRKTGAKVKEVVAGESFLKWSCESALGRIVMDKFGSRRITSSLMGHYQNASVSRRGISGFVQQMEIDMEEAERPGVSDYHSFNDFFARKLKPEARVIDAGENVVASPVDGRILAYQNLEAYQVLQVKGKYFSIKDLLGDATEAKKFENGSCIVARLNPSDYHRFHFPVACVPSKHQVIHGRYYSVNPLSLARVDEVYCKNVRHITYLMNEVNGRIAMIEVGATLVGSVVQTYQADHFVKKGGEKGFFQFGGSTVILLFQPGRIRLDEDLVDNTIVGFETLVQMGEPVGKR